MHDPVLPSKTSKVLMEPKWTVSKADRFPEPTLKQPGPGDYVIPSKGTEGPRFTTRP